MSYAQFNLTLGVLTIGTDGSIYVGDELLIDDEGLNPADIPGLIDYTAKGDLAVGNSLLEAEVLPIGTNGQVLSVDLTTSTGVKWVTPSGGGGVTFTAQGDLVGGGAGAASTIIPVGTTGQVLKVGTTSPTLLEWSHVLNQTGTNGQYLRYNSTESTKTEWVTLPVGGSSTLQGSYNVSTQPIITLSSIPGEFAIRDAATPIGGTLFSVKNNIGSVNYLTVDANGIAAPKATVGTFQITTSPTTGYVLTSDAVGNATWQQAVGAASLQDAYNLGNEIVIGTTGVQIKDAAAPISGSLFQVTDNAGTTTYMDVRAGCVGFGIGCAPTFNGQIMQSGGQFSSPGDAHSSQFVMFRQTTDGSIQDLYLDGAAQVLSIPDNSTSFFNVTLIASQQASTNVASYKFEYTVLKQVGAGTIQLPSGVDKIEIESVPAWDASIAVNTADGTMRIKVTGAAATTIRWVARVEMVQVRF